MPLTPAYTWSETEAAVRIEVCNVPIRDQSQIFCSDRVVKLNAPPYLLLLDLHGLVDDDRCVAAVHHGCKVVFQLAKAERGLWGCLVAKGDKHTIKQQRDASVQRAHEKQLVAAQERLTRRQQQDKAAVDLQIAEERAQRSRIEALKQQELCHARQELQDWQQQLPACTGPLPQQQETRHACSYNDQDSSDYSDDESSQLTVAAAAGAPGACAAGSNPGMPDHDDYHGRGWNSSQRRHAAATTGPETAQTGDAAQSADGEAADPDRLADGMAAAAADSEIIVLKAGRKDSPTNSWLQDSAAGHSISSSQLLLTGSQTADEQGLGLCCDIWASSSQHTPAPSGTVTSSSSSSSHRNRTTSIGPDRPIKPIAPMRPQAEPVAVSFTRLETAHLPAREQREVEIKAIKRSSQSDSMDIADRQPAYLKDKGDALAAQGNYRGAVNAYSRALELDPAQPALWSNRSACHLALGNLRECADDCSSAVQLMQKLREQLEDAPSDSSAQEVAAGLLPAACAAPGVAQAAGAATAGQVSGTATQEMDLPQPGDGGCDGGGCRSSGGAAPPEQAGAEDGSGSGDLGPSEQGDASSNRGLAASAGPSGADTAGKLQQMLGKLLARRAAALAQLGQLQEAEQDLQQALRLDPVNPRLQADALELQAALQPCLAEDPASIKQRGDARFKAGDAAGGVEAYTLLIQLMQQRQQQLGNQQQEEEEEAALQQQGQQLPCEDGGTCQGAPEQEQPHNDALLLSALSNRAACWLSLQQYQQCVDDCSRALSLALPVAAPEAVAAPAKDADDATYRAASMLQLLAAHPPELLLAGQHGPGVVRAVARLVSRMAVALGCLKQVQCAAQLFDCAQQYWAALGDNQRVAELVTDRERLLLPLTQQ